MPKDILDPSIFRKLLRYEPDTGRLFWLPRDEGMFRTRRAFSTWNSRYAGASALAAAHIEGYRHGAVFGTHYLAHRVIWAMQTGSWPECEVDHINRNRADNRWANLREANGSENSSNQCIRSTNTSGYKGASWDKREKKWRSEIKASGKQHFLGYFPSAEAAHAAYCGASAKLHGEFGRTA